jgi:acetolactate synthase I/II/III large subunit
MYKPVLLLGNGCRNNPALVEYLCSLGIPVLTTWPACDLVSEDSPVFCGRPGGIGQRAANIIQQKASSLFVFGARLDQQQVYFDYEGFARRANIVVYDIDKAELDKLPISDKWLKCVSDLTDIKYQDVNLRNNLVWLRWCRDLYNRFRPELDGQEGGKYIDPFYFMRLLSDYAKPDDILAMGSSGNAPNAFLQTFKIKRGQKFVNASTMGLMGADIPMAIGACIGSGKQRTLCATGDGGIMMNIQELEVVRRLNLPIKFFVFNNNGYGSIRAMQNSRFEGNLVGCDPTSGLTLPRIADRQTDYGGIAEAFGIHSSIVRNSEQLKAWFDGGWWSNDTPYILELMIDPDWQQWPKVVNKLVDGKFVKTPMQDMTPEIDDLEEIMRWGDE